MKNIQAQYIDLVEGKMSKANFMRNVRMQFPQFVAPTTSFDDSIRILKSKQILTEAKQPAGVYGHNPNAEAPKTKNIDHLDYYQVYHGIQYELSKMPEISDENYVKARTKVVNNILKNPDAYRELQLANYKAVKEIDKNLKMKEVKKDNLTDKANEMKVIKKDVKGNTQDSLGKKEAKKAKNGKGLQHMTQTPKGKLDAFPTPGKEKVIALKEHILDEMTTGNPYHEEIHKGSRVKKKDGSKAGQVVDFDGQTATVKWDTGGTEDVQRNVLTSRDVPAPTDNYENPLAKMPNLGAIGQNWLSNQAKKGGIDEDLKVTKEQKMTSLREKIVKMFKEVLYKKGNQSVTASSQQSAAELKRAGYREVPNTQDIKAI